MKRIVVRGTLKDLKNTANVISEREKMIADADCGDVVAHYPVNMLANELHPKYFPLAVKESEKLGGGMYVKLSFKDDCCVFRFKGGQWLGIRYVQNGDEKFSSLPVMSVSGKKEVEIYFTESYDPTAFEYFSSEGEKEILGVSFEGTLIYSGIRDSENAVIVTDETAFAAAVGFAKNIVVDYKNAFVNIFSDCSQELIEKSECGLFGIGTKAIGTEIRLCTDKKYSVFIIGEKDFCDKAYRTFFADNKRFASVISYPVNIVKEHKGEKEFKCKVIYRGIESEIVCFEGERLSSAFLRAGIPVEIRCSDGRCGYCRCKLLGGKTGFLGTENDYSTAADKKYGYIHPCCTTALSDIVVEI